MPPPPPQAQQAGYAGVGANGDIYELVITENTGKYVAKSGDTYTLTITTPATSTVRTSAGTITDFDGAVFTLKTSTGGSFSVEVSGADLKKLTVTVAITFEDGTSSGLINETLRQMVTVPTISSLTYGNAALSLTWTAADNAVTYEVYVDAGTSIPGTPALTVAAPATAATLTGLSNGTLYHVWVKAINPAGFELSAPKAAAPWGAASDFMAQFAGLWDSYYDGYIISTSAVEYDDYTATYPMEFAGDVKYGYEYNADTSDANPGANGVIIIEYTSVPGSPYTTGTSNFLGIYYKRAAGGIKFANSYDAGGTNIANLAEAVSFYTPENEDDLIFNWPTIYVQYKQAGTIVDMGALRGTWLANDDPYGDGSVVTAIRINDYRLTAYWDGAYGGPVYSGVIVERTDPAASTGYIYIQFVEAADDGITGVGQNNYYVLYWYTNGAKKVFSVYNDNDDIIMDAASLDTLKTYTALDPYFIDDTYHPNYNGYGGLLYDDVIFVEFTKQ
jgi:hypothetical protein